MSKKRLNANIDREEYKELKMKLLKRGMTITEWIIQKVKEYLKSE